MLLTYTTVKESYRWIIFEDTFQGSCSAGTDGIDINVEERFSILVSGVSSYCFR